MESRLDYDFSRVRLHTDPRAAESARAVNAAAYTVGNHVVLDGGINPRTTDETQALLAHELTHVIQQRDVNETATDRLVIGLPDDPKEREADDAMRNIQRITPAPVSKNILQRAQTVPSPQSGRTSPTQSEGTTGQASPRDVIAIVQDYSEARGLGKFDAILYRDCSMKIQFRMNFNFQGAWPKESDKVAWQNRFIKSVRAGWGGKFGLEATGACRSGCSTVHPFVEIYAPHANPHVVVNVTYTDKFIQSSAGYGGASLDSLDVLPVSKGGPEEQVPALHEFGHLTGLPDRYLKSGGCANGYPPEGVMCMGSQVTDKDYQPFANALNQMTGCTYKVASKSVSRGAPIGIGGAIGLGLGIGIGSLFGPIGALAGGLIGGGLGALAGALFG
jgi:hypothetical protein